MIQAFDSFCKPFNEYYSEEDIMDREIGMTEIKIACAMGNNFTLECTQLMERIVK